MDSLSSKMRNAKLNSREKINCNNKACEQRNLLQGSITDKNTNDTMSKLDEYCQVKPKAILCRAKKRGTIIIYKNGSPRTAPLR